MRYKWYYSSFIVNRRKITDVTRKEIFTLFSEGYIEHTFSLLGSTEERMIYAYNGDISEILFLSELYQLEKMPSLNHRFNNALDDIYQHTVKNDDWELGWVFYDSRFNLKECEDEELLKFICRIFHPTVRNENACWKGFLDRIQNLLKPDGYELYTAELISGRAVYKWRELTEYEIRSNRFVPFSERFKGCSIQIPSISRNKRKALVELMHHIEENLPIVDDTGYQDYKYSCQIVMDEIKEFYKPKAYNDKNEYIEENDFDRFVIHTSPKSVFDVIELYSLFNNGNFSYEVNKILSDIGYKLVDGKMMIVRTNIDAEIPQEQTLKDLILEAEHHYRSKDINSKQRALEKIWDAFERVKTYYYTYNKRDSIEKIIQKISNEDTDLKNRLDAEFKELTEIGNNYQIRHFETNKKPITDIRIKEYWYTRCLAIINLVIRFVEK